jgi:hypothetical protein
LKFFLKLVRLRRMSEFGRHALVEPMFQMPTEERIGLTLSEPNHPRAMALPSVNKITTARIRQMVSQLSAEAYPEVLQWLRTVAHDSPAKAIELYIELLQFSIPKVKAVAVAVNDTSAGAPHKLSLADLQAIVSEQ